MIDCKVSRRRIVAHASALLLLLCGTGPSAIGAAAEAGTSPETIAAVSNAGAGTATTASAPTYEIVPGPGVVATGWIGDHHPSIRGSALDSPYFVLEGALPGGTLFVLGGCHPSEPSGILAAVLLVERAEVEQGRIVVVPWGNSLAVTQRRVSVDTPTGLRHFRYGERRSLATHYEDEDPQTYTTPTGGEYPGNERRNLNRVWPGVPDGTPTERIAHAIVETIRAYGSDLAFDLHETSNLGGNLPWTIAGRESVLPLLRAAVRSTNRAVGLDLTRWRAEDGALGMSRVEWGPATGAAAFLTETVTGHITPLSLRIAVQIEWIRGVVDAFNALPETHGETSDRRIRFAGVPAYAEIATGDLGTILQPAVAATD
jgi:predicted deacylase